MGTKNTLTPLILVIIVVFAFFIRFLNIGSVPKGALVDEAHFGYLAYSLLETGKDEHGVSYPVIFRGFGDNKLPLQAYLMMPVVKFFGLSNATIRYPSVVAGTALVVVMFYIIRELKFKEEYALAGAFITAVMPWSFFLSRFGFESNLGMLFFSLGLLFLLKLLKNKSLNKLAIVAGVSFGLSWYSYIVYRPVSLLVLFGLAAFLFWQDRKLSKMLNNVLLVIAFMTLTVLPLMAPGAIGANETRFKQVGILSDEQIPLIVNENRNFCGQRLPRPVCDIFWNKYVVISKELAYRFLNVYSPQFLATVGEGENQFLTIDGHGQLLFFLYPILLIGIFYLVIGAKKLDDKHRFLIALGLLIAPLPTILVGQPQQVRMSPLFPFLVITIILGLQQLMTLKINNVIKQGIMFVVVTGVLFQSGHFFVDYFTIHSVKQEQHYQSYLPGLFEFIETLDKSKQVVIKPFFSDPLMFYAYYTQMDPAFYQEQAVLGELEASGFQHTVELGRLSVSSDSISYLGCEMVANDQEGVLVTNEELSRPLLYEGKSASGVHSFVYVYDATTQLDPETCL